MHPSLHWRQQGRTSVNRFCISIQELRSGNSGEFFKMQHYAKTLLWNLIIRFFCCMCPCVNTAGKPLKDSQRARLTPTISFGKLRKVSSEPSFWTFSRIRVWKQRKDWTVLSLNTRVKHVWNFCTSSFLTIFALYSKRHAVVAISIFFVSNMWERLIFTNLYRATTTLTEKSNQICK